MGEPAHAALVPLMEASKTSDLYVKEAAAQAMLAVGGKENPKVAEAFACDREFADYDLVVSDAAGCTAHLKELQHWSADGSALAERVLDGMRGELDVALRE